MIADKSSKYKIQSVGFAAFPGIISVSPYSDITLMVFSVLMALDACFCYRN